MEQSPFWGMVGPKERISDLSLQLGFIAFYKTWIQSKSGNKAVDALNRSVEGDDPFYFRTAERFFGTIYLKFLKDGKAIADQARDMHHKMEKRNGAWRRPSVAAVKRHLRNGHQGFFDRCKSTYFMIDQFPEVDGRIGIELEDVTRQL